MILTLLGTPLGKLPQLAGILQGIVHVVKHNVLEGDLRTGLLIEVLQGFAQRLQGCCSR